MNIKNFSISSKNRFFSNTRHNNKKLIIDEKNDNINNTLEQLKKYIVKDITGEYYYKAMHKLNECVVSKNLTEDEALIILINFVDPECRMYKIYEEYCNIKQIKSRIKFIFGFYDEDFFKIEKQYVIDNGLKNEYSFIKKMD